MHKKIILLVSFISIGLPSLVVLANQADLFVVKKKKVVASKSKLKEQNAHVLTTMLQALPAHIKAVADLQEVAMDKVSAYIEGQKNCFWADASCERLDECLTKIEDFQKQLVHMQAQLRECATFLNSL
jgi:hypothetical protein